MPHIERLAQLLNRKNPDIERQFGIDILCSLLKINDLLLPIDDVPLIKLQAGRDAVAQRMHFLISPPSSRPLDSSQVVHIGLQYEAMLAEYLMYDVFNGVFSVSLVLQPQELFPVVPEEDSHLYLEAFSAFLLGLLGLHNVDLIL